MNVVASSTLRNNIADVLQEVSEKRDYLLVSKRGTISSAIVNIDFFEDLLALASKDYLISIKKAREEYANKEYFTHKEVFGSL